MFRKTVISIIVTTIILLTTRAGVCAPVTVEKIFPAIEWSFQGKPIPETHWSPWIPLLSQQVLRLKFGFRFSSGTIGAKCPVKLTFTYDPAQATSGGSVPIKVKAELLGADYNTFESAFGISLPNQMQIGFFGISGLPDFLPWWDLPWDFWDFVSFVPKVGDAIASAEQNIGVNTSSKEALPLGSTKSYHDQRTLISVDMSEIAKKYKTQLSPSVYNKLSSALGNDGMEALLTTIAVAKGVSENAAVDILTGLCGDVVEKAASFASIALKGDPYFSVEGLRLGVNMRCFIPGGKGSGSYILYFTSPGQEQTFNFYDITPFIDAGDKLKIVVDRLDYEFKLRQGLTAQAGISLATINLDNVEKVVSYVHATKDYTENDFKIEVPLSASTATIQGLRVNMGCTSAAVDWASPILPLKGTVKAYDGGTQVKMVSETGFFNAHNVIITGLTKNKTYKFTMECVGQSGQSISGGEITGTTQSDCQVYSESAVAGDLYYVSTLPPTPGRDFVDFNWVTNKPASTEVMISPSPELAVASIGCIKKDDGTANGTVVQGWGTRGGERKLETNHPIRITGLEPGVKYYYLLRSWSFEGDNPQNPDKYCLGKLGEVTTLAIPVPQIKVKAQFRDILVPDVPILVSKVGNASYRLVVQTDSYGITPLITLDKGQRYTFAVKDHSCYENVTSSVVDVPNSDCGEMTSVTLTVTSKPSPGGYVFDSQGNPISGATVKMISGAPGANLQTTTDATGHFTYAGWFDFMGGLQVEVSKADYVTKKASAKVEACSYARPFVSDNCILPSAIAKVNFVVKTQKGNAVSGASLTIKELGTLRGTLTTDSQGKATFSYNPGDNNLNNHTLTVAMQPPTGAKIRPKTASLTTIGGSEQTCEIPCLEVTTGPLISKVTFSQSALNCILVAFEVSDEDANSCLEYTRPDGQTGTTNWVKGGHMQGSGVSSHACTIQGNPIPTGVYNIKVKAMDVFGNISQTDVNNFTLFGGPLWNLKVTMAGRNATLRWAKFPYAKDFGKYAITVNSQTPIEISDVNTTSYNLTNLVPNTAYQVSIIAKPKTGAYMLAYPASVSFGTQSMPPVINSLTVTPELAATGQQIQVSAQVTDLDTNIKKVELTLVSEKDKRNLSTQNFDSNNVTFTHTFQSTTAGAYTLFLAAFDETNVVNMEKKITVLAVEKPTIVFANTPANCKIKEDCNGTVRVTNIAKIEGKLICDVNWGDGKKETAEMGPTTAGKKKSMLVAKEEEKTGDSFSIKHQYQNQGSFTVTATVSNRTDKLTVTSEPLTATVNVTAAAMETSLTRDTTKGSNDQVFHIKAAAGSYPITSWTLTFGDGQSTSGQGTVDKNVSHRYLAKGDYGVEFTIKDSQNTEVKKTVALKIARDVTASDLGGGTQSQLQQVQPGGTQPPAGDQLQKADKTGQTVKKSGTQTQTKTTTTQADANKPQDTAKTQELTKTKEQAKTQEAAKPQEEVKTEEVEKETVIAEKGKVQSIDLAILDLKVPGTATAGKAISIEVSIKDNNDIPVEKVGVSLYAGIKKIETQEINLKPKETKKLTFSYTPEKTGTLTIKVKIEKVKGFRDVNLKNDALTEKVEVK